MDEGNNDFDFDFMPIGQAIKKAREARGMIREQLSKYTDPATASVSAAHFIHVGSGKTPEDYRDLAVLPCHRNGNIRSGASDLPSRQKNRNALQRYKNTVRTGKEETIWKYILKKG